MGLKENPDFVSSAFLLRKSSYFSSSAVLPCLRPPKLNSYMILNDEEASARLSSPDNLVNIIYKEIPNHGNTEGSTEIPPMVRKLIGAIANRSGETQAEIGDTFGVGTSTVSRSSRGLVGDYRFDPELASSVRPAKEARKNEIASKTADAHELALDSLVSSLNHLNPKLELIHDPKVLSRVASDMAKITSNLANSKRAEAGVINSTQVVLFGVPQRKESAYETIDI